MRMRYSAYGLVLDCSFPIEGMERAAADVSEPLPKLAVEMSNPAKLRRDGGTAGAEPEWHGRLGDGLDFKIDRDERGGLLFSYGERACFSLDPNMSRLGCAPLQQGLDWQRVLISKVIPSISVMRGYEALHAASVDSSGGVLAIMAPSGTGKSTLAGELLRRGDSLFADDQLTLDYGVDGMVAHPGTPHMNFPEADSPGIDPGDLGSTLAVLGGERWVAVRNLTAEPRPVRMLCLLERGSGLDLDLEVLAPNPLLLAPYMLGLSMDAERQRARFALYADLMGSTPTVRLRAGLGHSPQQMADLIEQALSDTSGQPVAELA
jgi:hypothetical protein